MNKYTIITYQKEIRQQLRLFIPFLLGQLSNCAMGTVDTVMAGLAGTKDISGVAIACSFYWPAYMCLAGFASAITPTVSHLIGAKRENEIANAFFNSLIFCVISGFILAIALSLCHLVYNFIDADKEMIYIATNYLYFVAFSLPATVLFNCCRAFCEGHSFVKPSLYLSILMLVLDIPLNYIFIFGKFGMPALGGIGCGATSCFINIVTAAIFFFYIKYSKRYKATFNEFKLKLDLEFLKKFIKLSVPTGLSRTMEVMCFTIAAVMLSPFGPAQVAAHSICVNVSSLVFMIPLSLCITATIRVSLAMGQKSFKKAILAIKVLMIFNFALLVVYMTYIFIERDFIAGLYSNDISVVKLASILMILNCIYMIPDSIQAIMLGVLHGFKDSKFIFYTTLCCFILTGIPLSYILSWGVFTTPLMAKGIWISFIVVLLLVSIVTTARVTYIFKTKHLPKLLKES